MKDAKAKDWGSLIVFIFLCLGVGFVDSGLTVQAIPNWYVHLTKPFGNPPNWIFAPVWTVLYVLMAISAWRIWRLRHQTTIRKQLIIFWAQLGLNALWSPVFFGLRNPGFGLFIILLLWTGIFFTQKAFRKTELLAANLLLPYLAWVSYATYLNAGIWWLNR